MVIRSKTEAVTFSRVDAHEECGSDIQSNDGYMKVNEEILHG